MQVVVTNISPGPVNIADIYRTLAPSESVTFSRSAAQLTAMAALQRELAAGTVSAAYTPSADELASGLLSAPASIQAVDSQPVSAATGESTEDVIRIPLAAGVGGAPDDVTRYALNAVPYKFRIVDVWALVSTAVALATLEVRTQAAGAGTLLATLPAATTGRQAPTAFNTSPLVTPGATVGIFVRRADGAVVGEVFLAIRRET